MSMDIHIAKDRDELAAAREAVAEALMACKGFSPAICDTAVDAVMKAMFSHFAGGRVYFPGGKGRSLPADQQARIEMQLLAGDGDGEIAADLKVHRSTVWRVRKRMEESPALRARMTADRIKA